MNENENTVIIRNVVKYSDFILSIVIKLKPNKKLHNIKIHVRDEISTKNGRHSKNYYKKNY